MPHKRLQARNARRHDEHVRLDQPRDIQRAGRVRVVAHDAELAQLRGLQHGDHGGHPRHAHGEADADLGPGAHLQVAKRPRRHEGEHEAGQRGECAGEVREAECDRGGPAGGWFDGEVPQASRRKARGEEEDDIRDGGEGLEGGEGVEHGRAGFSRGQDALDEDGDGDVGQGEGKDDEGVGDEGEFDGCGVGGWGEGGVVAAQAVVDAGGLQGGARDDAYLCCTG